MHFQDIAEIVESVLSLLKPILGYQPSVITAGMEVHGKNT